MIVSIDVGLLSSSHQRFVAAASTTRWYKMDTSFVTTFAAVAINITTHNNSTRIVIEKI